MTWIHLHVLLLHLLLLLLILHMPLLILLPDPVLFLLIPLPFSEPTLGDEVQLALSHSIILLLDGLSALVYCIGDFHFGLSEALELTHVAVVLLNSRV